MLRLDRSRELHGIQNISKCFEFFPGILVQNIFVCSWMKWEYIYIFFSLFYCTLWIILMHTLSPTLFLDRWVYVLCCKFWIYWECVNTNFSTWQLVVILSSCKFWIFWVGVNTPHIKFKIITRHCSRGCIYTQPVYQNNTRLKAIPAELNGT